jgi:hypothetical protein
VPFNHDLRLHDRQCAQHLRSQTIQASEYQTVPASRTSAVSAIAAALISTSLGFH